MTPFRGGLLSALSLVALVGGGAPARGATEVDDLGVAVEVKARPRRVVSLAPNNTEILYALGLGDAVVGVTVLCNWPPAAVPLAKVADYTSMDVEKVLALKPDLVVAARGNDLEGLKGLRDLGVPVFALDLQSVAQVLGAIDRLGRLTGAEAEAKALRDSLERRIGAVEAAVRGASSRPRVMWTYWAEPVYTTGAGTIVDDVFTRAGAENVGRRAPGRWPQVGLETIVGWAPEVLVTTYMANEPRPENLAAEVARLRTLEGWKSLPAVQQGRVHYLDADLLTRPGPRLVDALEQAAALFHPELFRQP